MAGLQIMGHHSLVSVCKEKREVEEPNFSTCFHGGLQMQAGTCWKGHHWTREGLNNPGIEFRQDSLNFEAQKPQRKFLVK